MEKFLEKFDTLAETIFNEFEKKPISTSVKALIIYWIFRKIQSMSRR